jgi:prune family protein 2
VYFCTGLGEPPPVPVPIPELSAAEERSEARSWRSVVVAGLERRIDMKVIEPYKRVCFTILLNLLVPA